MADMQQSLRQASIRAVTSTTGTYEGDWHALWDSLSTPGTTFNERMLNYINTKLSASYTEINSAMAGMAAAESVDSFQAIGTFTPSAGGDAPVNTVAPAVTGTAVEGYTLTTDDGTWTGDATITYAYQWKRGVTNVGADQNTYTLVAADEGQNITCTVTATNGVGSDDAVSNTVSVFNPTALFASTEKGFIIDPTRIATLWQDTGATSAISADNQLIARVDDRSDNSWNGVQSTSGLRPLYNTTDHALGAIEGVSGDWLDFTSAASTIFQNAAYGTVIAFVNLDTLSAVQTIFMGSRNDNQTLSRLALRIDATNHAQIVTRRLDADSSQVKASTNTVTAADHVLCAEADWANTLHGISIDLNAAETAVPTWGAGSATSNTASLGVTVGALASSADPTVGDLGRLIAINRQLTSDERTAAIKWCGKGGGMSL